MRILLTGPTAVGKTDISLKLARRFCAEIISSDSRQCYKYLNIGTSTPSKSERGGIPHFNLSIIDPSKKDSAGQFYRRAMQWEQEINARNHTILYVGGSTLHQRCIIEPFDDMPAANENHINQLENEIAAKGITPLFERLKKSDPAYAAQMDGMNRQRIIRALDVWMQTGRPFSSFHSKGSIIPADDLLVIGLRRGRQKLYKRINQRAERMLANNFLDEVRSILDQGYSLSDPGLNTVGYKQAIDHLNGQISRDKMLRDIKTKTRRYAKRQLTYFKRWDFVHWFDLEQASPEIIIRKIVDQFSREVK